MNDVNQSMAPPIEADHWPAALDSMRGSFAERLNVYKVMAHHPALLLAWGSLRQHIVIDNSLGKRLSEFIILRVGYRWGSTYEWGQHVVRGRAEGLTDAEIDSARANPDTWPADATESLLMRGVDALLDQGELTEQLIGAIAAHTGLAGVFDLMATVGMYSTLAFIVKSFKTPLEPDIRAAAHPLLA